MKRSVFYLLFVLIAAFAQAGPSLPFAEDLSILFPLPQAQDSSVLLSPASATPSGPLLPVVALQQLPPLAPNGEPATLIANLRVVAARLDPCFPDLQPGRGCRPQLRLAFQSLRWDTVSTPAQPHWTTEDAAVHAFYEISGQEFTAALDTLAQLRAQAGIPGSAPEILGVHRGLRALGLSSPYAQGLKRLILSLGGGRRLSRMTFFVSRGKRDIWKFGGFDIASGAFQPMPIVGAAEQYVDGSERGLPLQAIQRESPRDLTSMSVPEITSGDRASFFFRNPPTPPTPDVATNLVTLNRIENPHLSSSRTVDCLSCHMAESSRLYAWRVFGQAGAPDQSAYRPFVQRDPEIARAGTPAVTTNFRAFGYFDQTPTVNQRVVNETSTVLELLRTMLH